MSATWEQQTTDLLTSDAYRMACLRVARSLSLPDWCLGAGFLRNAIWDACHHYTTPTPLNDIDLVYFDPENNAPARDFTLEQQARNQLDAKWEVRNQARMHEKHGNAPYHNVTQAIAHWVEVPTCVGVRLNADDSLSFIAPFGLEENWQCQVRINPCMPRPEIYYRRINEKNWAARWPQLRFL